MKHDRSVIMRRAHQLRLREGLSLSDALKRAWAEAKAPPPAVIRPGVADRAIAMVRALKGARLEIAFRVRADIGVRVTPKSAPALAYVAGREIAAGYEGRAI